jgi:predicted HicB family RNase H-like nuclease
MKTLDDLNKLYWNIDELTNYINVSDFDADKEYSLHELIVGIYDSIDEIKDDVKRIKQKIGN